MNMNFLEIVTPTPAIYHGFSTQKSFWEEKFTPVNMTSCVRQNARKHRKIKNGENDYMGIPGKGLTTYLDLSTKGSNKKQNSRFYITEITNKDFRNFLENFKNSPYLG